MQGQGLPQSGAVVSRRGHRILGAPLIARRDEPAYAEASDLSNVVPFARRHGAVDDATPLILKPDDRPAPPPAGPALWRRMAFVAGSLALHSALLAAFWHEPRPLASIGAEAMTIEITIGATTAAGVAPMPGETEAQVVSAAETTKEEQEALEQSQVATAMPQDVPVAAQEAAPELKPQEPRPLEPQVTASETARVEIPTASVEQKPADPVAPDLQKPAPPAQTQVRAPEPRRTAAPTEQKASPKQRTAAAPSNPASGVGRGRSDNMANYHGMVSAHLARHKRYPADAQRAGTTGVASVSFSLDGGGRVTSVRLASGSGVASIDQEVVAMVRRASPFPAPPDGRSKSFTVPVRFNIR
jgi:periplasmic protein TonB